ncbi:MAG: class I SAM-dependent methyltransferase [Blautia sp.]|nr:class I SAM-dependent methyltransferase [Blautia sp.]
MEAYTCFAQVYDLFMDNVPYEAWSKRLCSLLRGAGIDSGTVVELGCGTGRLTRLLAARYDMIGVDNSLDMLQIAGQESDGILYLLQDMRKLSLCEAAAAVCSACDSLNYILGTEELAHVFALVYRWLLPGGLFIFDMNTPYKYRELLAENTFAENREDGSFIWENAYDPATRVNEYGLTLFIKEGTGLFRRMEETHFQRCYEPAEVEELLRQAGFALLGVYDDYSERPLAEDSERALFVARREDA